MPIQKIKSGRIITVDLENYVGEAGHIFFDELTGDMRLSDGVTPGGTPIGGGGGGGSYTLLPATTTRLGGVKLGTGLSVTTSGTISVNYSNFSDVAFSGNYSDLSGAPTKLSDFTNDIGISTGTSNFSGSYNDLTDKPLFSIVSTSGSYTDLINKPVFSTVSTSGSYTDLINKPTNLSDFINDLTIPTALTVNDLTNVQNLSFGTGFTVTETVSGTAEVNYTSGAVGGSTVIKTFNILNEFSAPLIGNSIYVPEATSTIRSIQITNGMGRVGSDLMVGLYRNNDLLGFYSIPAGSITKKYTDLSHIITSNDYITVNVVAGNGGNLTMVLFNT